MKIKLLISEEQTQNRFDGWEDDADDRDAQIMQVKNKINLDQRTYNGNFSNWACEDF